MKKITTTDKLIEYIKFVTNYHKIEQIFITMKKNLLNDDVLLKFKKKEIKTDSISKPLTTDISYYCYY